MDSYLLSRTNEVEGYMDRNCKNIKIMRRDLDRFEKENRKLAKD